jgi:serine protease Do
MLEEIATAARAVIERSAASVVRLGRGRSAACAVVVSDRHLVANAHSIVAERMTVRAADGRELEASVVGVDRDGDLAVLEVADPGPALAYAETPPAVGSVVFAVGMAAKGPRLTAGLVSAIDDAFWGPHGRRIHGSIEHTAPLAPGSSGSALLDTKGRLLGINTSRLGRGFYVALPADEGFRERLARLAAGEQLERIRLGITIAPPWIASRMRAAVGLQPREGLLVREVEEDSPAARSGLAVGDLLVGVDGTELVDPDDLAELIDAAPERLEFTVLRGEQELAVSVTLREP